MKKKLFIACAAAIMLSVSGCSSEVTDAYNDALSQAQQEVDEQVAAIQDALSGSGSDETESDAEASSEAQTEASDVSSEPQETPETENTDEPDADGSPSTGVYEVDGISVNYYASVRNDVTGNWRLGVIYDGSDLNSYVVDYYNFFCRDDSEVHGIVNLGTKTTVLISKVMSNTLEISVMEYVDGEEHDAKLLYSGDELERYWIDMDTLEVDPIEDDE